MPSLLLRRLASTASVALVIVLLCAWVPAASAAEPARLAYVGRFDTEINLGKHRVNVEVVLDHYALISSTGILALVDLVDPPPPGSPEIIIDFLDTFDPYSTVTRPDGYIYANLFLSGLGIAHLDADTLTLTHIDKLTEPDVYYERMALVGDRLYVTAHAHGIRIFDLTDPAAPVLVGALYEGFDDAMAIAVRGDRAYVADGAGGLKIVDIADEQNPVIIGGETTTSAAATAEDVLLIGSDVYVACGGAGVAVYPGGGLASRVIHDTPMFAKQLARVGPYIAVADGKGVEILGVEPGGGLSFVTRESCRRRHAEPAQLSTRLWLGVAGWGDDHVVVANWDTVDLYRLDPLATGTQPDILSSTQRVRFEPSGGSTTVEVANAGAGTLSITNVTVDIGTVHVSPPTAVLPPGATLDLSITYDGGLPGSALVLLHSNDPDEPTYPIEVFGDTPYLDPGEPAIPFTLESWTYDREHDEFIADTFTLADHAGKIVYFHIYGHR
ncbi:MAG: hypothetical protein ACYTGP_08280 [Planctomycetota bacterium]|jgi:hypothetical protein